jgi:hypothetical protein
MPSRFNAKYTSVPKLAWRDDPFPLDKPLPVALIPHWDDFLPDRASYPL